MTCNSIRQTLYNFLVMMLAMKQVVAWSPRILTQSSFSHCIRRSFGVRSLALSSSCSSTSSQETEVAASDFPKCKVLLFDLDGTLYDGDNGMKEFMQGRIHQFMVDKTGEETGDPKFDEITTREQARAIWEPLFAKYNQSLRGLHSAGYKIDAAEFNAYFRDGTENFMERDEKLREVLKSLPQQKIIFTNAPEASATKNLDRMGILDCFDGVYGAETMGTGCCKPEMEAFEKVLGKIGIDAHDQSACSEVCFFEDSFMNLVQGKEMGMQTVFLYCSTAEEEGKDQKEAHELFDAVIANVGQDLESSMPWLWNERVDEAAHD